MSDEEYLSICTFVKRRGQNSGDVLDESDVINQNNAVLYEEDFADDNLIKK